MMNDEAKDRIVDEAVIAKELRKILDYELPAGNSQEKELYQELEKRIRQHNAKMLSDSVSSKKKSMKAKILAASSLARARGELSRRPAGMEVPVRDEGLLEAGGPEAAGAAEAIKEELMAKYKGSTAGSIRKELEGEGVFTKWDDEAGSATAAAMATERVGYSPLDKLQRTVRKAQAVSRLKGRSSGGGGDSKKDGGPDSDDEIRELTLESENWLKKQKELERQLLAKSSKGALRQRYMAKGIEDGEDVEATDKRIEDLLERVMREGGRKGKGEGVGKGAERKGGIGGKQRPDMADVVRKAMALRQEAEAEKETAKPKVVKKTAKKTFPVKLESSDSEESAQEDSESNLSGEDDDDEDSDGLLGNKINVPDLTTPTDSSEEESEDRLRRRIRPKYEFRKSGSIDIGGADDAAVAIEEAKRLLGQKPEKPQPPHVHKLLDRFPPEVEAYRSKLKSSSPSGEPKMDFKSAVKTFTYQKKAMDAVASKTSLKPTKLAESSLSKSRLSTPTATSSNTLKTTTKPKPTTDLSSMKQRRPSIGSGRSATKFI